MQGLAGGDWWLFDHVADGKFPAAQLQEPPARPLVAVI